MSIINNSANLTKIIFRHSQIPFPLLASLNGVALFGESHDVALLSTDVTEADCRVIWRDYHASVRLVLVAPVHTRARIFKVPNLSKLMIL